MNEQMQDRIAKLEKIRALGVEPYGGRFTGVTSNAEIRAAGEAMNIEIGQILESDDATFTAAGRVALNRAFGNLIFLTVRDQTGEIQFGLSKKVILRGNEATERPGNQATRHEGTQEDRAAAQFLVPEAAWKVAKLLDLGDIVGVRGKLGRTKTGELTLWVSEFTILSKALRPPPEKRLGLTDIEARYRRRYVDLFSNPESREVFVQRAKIIDHARRVLHERRFIEVETPALQPLYGGAAARPFMTHHNTLDMDLYLRISPELYLKRCLVGGLERVYEFSRCFRNEGISPRHNPEFTMLELYQAYGDYHDMMDITEAIIAGAARGVIGSCQIPADRSAAKSGAREGEAPAEPPVAAGDRNAGNASTDEEAGSAGASPSHVRVIDYSTPWPRRKYADLFREHVGIDMGDIAAIRARARELHESGHLKSNEAHLDDPVVINELFEHYVEPKLINPTFVCDYPAPLCPLTRRHPDDSNVALRFEAFINGMEIGNAYTELNDPAVQRENFSGQLRGEEDETMAIMDDDFVEALECAMPPAGGLGLGVDRIVMLLTGSTSIRDVILFPLQRPQQGLQREGEAPAEPPSP